MPIIPSKKNQEKTTPTKKASPNLKVNTTLATQKRWVCPTCKTVHRGFNSDVCRNENCPAKVCISCEGTGKNSQGSLCRTCNGTKKRK